MLGEYRISIRQARIDDVTAIDSILRDHEGFLENSQEPPECTRKSIADHLEQCRADGSHTVLVACDGHQVLGYVGVHWLPYLMLPGSEAFVSELFVAASARGKGIGSRLLEAVREEANRRRCFRLMLVNRKTRESYRRGFYAKAGWTERHEFANFVMFLDRQHGRKAGESICGVGDAQEERGVA